MNGHVLMGLRFVAPLAVAVLAGPPLSAQAQVETREGIALRNEILELHNELDALRAQLAGGGSALGQPYQVVVPERSSVPPGDLTAQLLTRLGALEDQMRTLTGRVDELGNQVRRQGEQFSKQIGDLNFRLQGPEVGARGAPRAERVPVAPSGPVMSPQPSALGALPLPPPDEGIPPYPRGYPETSTGALPLLPPPSTLETQPNAPAPTSRQAAAGAIPLLPPSEAAPRANGPRTSEVVLREGEAALGRHDYAAAEAAAREVLGNGRSARAADAQYLLAQVLAGQRNYPQAAVAYDDAYRRSPTGPHAQEALLGMANALANLGSKPAACAALDKLQTEFLTQRGSVREAAAALRQREACHS